MENKLLNMVYLITFTQKTINFPKYIPYRNYFQWIPKLKI